MLTLKLHVSKQADIIQFIAETDSGCLLLFDVSSFVHPERSVLVDQRKCQ